MRTPNGVAGELVKRLEKSNSFLELDSVMDEFTHFSNLGRFTTDEKNNERTPIIRSRTFLGIARAMAEQWGGC